MPYCQKDICDWPITIEELEPHYRAVISLMKQSGNEDALNAVLPLNGDCYPFRLCRQADALLRDLDMSKAALEAEGVMFGRSRLAVAFEGVDGRQGCSYCGMCIYGCPYDLIYSAASTMDRLSANQNFRYQNGVLVEKLAEAGGEIKIQARSLYGSEELEFHGDRVFLAAGVLSSTRILLRSLDAFNRPLVIRHSEHFQLPLIRYRKTRDIASEELHTMTQVYIEIQDGDICDHMIHMQVYAYNDLYDVVMKKLLGPVAPLLKCPIEEILGRLLIIKGYLHSSCSSHIVARLEPGRSGALVLEGRPSDEANDIFRKIKTKLLRNRKYFRAVPSPKMAAIGIPGTGNHSGGSFPMRKTPAAFETDTLGRPCGFEKVHVVDATVFPSIPATTILLSIMANAHRIASAS
jgi:choline dehydrogenase-like flavoprotein